MRMERDRDGERHRGGEIQRKRIAETRAGLLGEVKRVSQRKKDLFSLSNLSSNDLHKMRRCLSMPPILLSGSRA